MRFFVATAEPRPTDVAQTLMSAASRCGRLRAQCHLVSELQWWSGPLACHVGIRADILRIIGITYLKNVGTNADMAGQRPAPPSARIPSDIRLRACATNPEGRG